MSSKDLEMQWLVVKGVSQRAVVIVNIYRPPQGEYKTACEAINVAYQEANLKDNADVFVMGDFNIDWKDKRSPAKRELDFTMGSLGLKALINQTTRYGSRQGNVSETCIDLIFSNSLCIAEVGTLDLNISDHLAVSVRSKNLRSQHPKVKFTGNFDEADFQLSLVNCS